MTADGVEPAQALHLVRALLEIYGSRAAAEPAFAAEAARALRLLHVIPPARGILAPSDHPVLRHLPQALAATPPHAAEASSALQQVGRHLPWRYGYARREDAPDLGSRIAFAEIVGPDAPSRSDAACVGVTLIAPHTLYPDHRHPAIELYYVLSGTATWRAGGRSKLAPPGTFVLHPSGVTHSMETHDEPLLAAYTWSGDDVKTTSTYG